MRLCSCARCSFCPECQRLDQTKIKWMRCQDDVLSFTEFSQGHLSTSVVMLLIGSCQHWGSSSLDAPSCHHRRRPQQRVYRNPYYFPQKRMIQSFAFVSEQRSFVCSAIPPEPSNELSGTMVHVWAIIIGPLKQRSKHSSVRPEFQNRLVAWQTSSHPDVFPLGHISEPAAGACQECYFTSLKSLKRFKDL